MDQLQMTFDSAQRTAPKAPEPALETRETQVEPASEKSTSQPEILTVSDLNRATKTTLETKYGSVWVKGEISNFKPHSSGHFYFSLKDAKAQISAAMFRNANARLKFKPRDGMEVIVRGRVTLFEARGSYQISCEQMEPVGAGALQLAFEELKNKLQLEGLFEAARKRPLPALPQHVVVITSPTGAAIRDILNVLGRRFKALKVTLIAAVVQGDAAVNAIIRAIDMAHQLPDVDVMIVGRGGGSIEDMWCFNDERLARAISASRIPTISAVGHEIDFTIADFVADLRAPTPSAAAELVCRNAGEIADTIQKYKAVLWRSLQHKFVLLKQKHQHASRMLVDPKRKLQDYSQLCDDLSARLRQAWTRNIERIGDKIESFHKRLPSPERKVLLLRGQVAMQESRLDGQVKRKLQMTGARLGELASVLDSLSPLKVVERGYSIVTKNAQVIRSYDQLKKGDKLEVKFAQGAAEVTVDQVTSP